MVVISFYLRPVLIHSRKRANNAPISEALRIMIQYSPVHFSYRKTLKYRRGCVIIIINAIIRKGNVKLKTAVTDRTLSYMKYDPEHTSAGALKAYANAVFNCGADYMEINSQTAALMALDDYSDKYMLTVNNAYDCGFCTGNRFAYAVVPFS